MTEGEVLLTDDLMQTIRSRVKHIIHFLYEVQINYYGNLFKDKFCRYRVDSSINIRDNVFTPIPVAPTDHLSLALLR